MRQAVHERKRQFNGSKKSGVSRTLSENLADSIAESLADSLTANLQLADTLANTALGTTQAGVTDIRTESGTESRTAGTASHSGANVDRSSSGTSGDDRLNRLERLERLDKLDRLERLDWLERLDRLDRLDRLERLEQLDQLSRAEAAGETLISELRVASDQSQRPQPAVVAGRSARTGERVRRLHRQQANTRYTPEDLVPELTNLHAVDATVDEEQLPNSLPSIDTRMSNVALDLDNSVSRLRSTMMPNRQRSFEPPFRGRFSSAQPARSLLMNAFSGNYDEHMINRRLPEIAQDCMYPVDFRLHCMRVGKPFAAQNHVSSIGNG